MSTLAQRLTAVNTLQRAGVGLVAIADEIDDVIAVKDPAPDHVPAGGGATPLTGQAPTVTWRIWEHVDAVTAYGL